MIYNLDDILHTSLSIHIDQNEGLYILCYIVNDNFGKIEKLHLKIVEINIKVGSSHCENWNLKNSLYIAVPKHNLSIG